MLITAVLTGAFNSAQGTVLHLGGRPFDPLTDSAADSLIPAQTLMKSVVQRSKAQVISEASIPGYYIVQFDSPIRPHWRVALKEAGATVLDYIPDFAYIIRLPESQTEAVSALEHVRWLGAYEADYRISREAKVLSNLSIQGEDGLATNGEANLRIDAFPGESRSTIADGIRELGGSIQNISESEWGICISATLPCEEIDRVAQISGVKWVEIRKPNKTSNGVAAGITDVRPVRTRAGGFYGEGQILAVCDSGLDEGSITDIHPDFLDGNGNSRVVNIYSWGDDSYLSDLTGHGTHVAGSAVGNGARSGADPAGNRFPETCHAGMAPKALLVFQAVSNTANSGLSGIPSDLKLLFQQALDAGACIHTNSWGTFGAGSYDSESADVDQFCWTNKDFLILFAAGNAGYDKDLNGIVDGYCIDSPATAKNCLSVGASESLRTVGGFAASGYGEFRTYAAPLASDLFSDNAGGLAAFSSRGPCLDGRTKPDLVAPGTNILSTRSAVQEGDGWGGYDDWYFYSGGSSMATPITAGAAVVLREYLTGLDQFRQTPPSSAMLKACLVNTAVDIAPGQYGDGAFQEIRRTPGPAAGWGRLSLDRAISPEFPDFITYADNSRGLETGEEKSFSVTGIDDENPLRITLAWTDYPAASAACGGLVNDLDLMVRDQDGKVFYPDNAQTQPFMSKVVYVESVSTTLNYERVAMRLTPDGYPRRLGSLFWAGSNPNSVLGDIEVAVYGADSNGYPAGNALFSTTIQYCPSGEFALPVDVEVTKGDLVAVFTFSTLEGMALYTQEDGNPDGRCLVDQGSGWETADSTAAVGGLFFSTNTSETFDRVNNLVGVTIENPSGEYTVTVKGYNVPQGPQPFALVISGTKTVTLPRETYPFWRERR